MAKQFDPYHEWLGIAPKDQPPNHYRLLGVDLFEANPNTIEHAADQRMAHLRTFQAGKHGAVSQKLLNEVAAAKICLLNPKKKAAYDQHLRETSQSSGSLDPELMEALRQAESRNVTAAAKRPQSLGILVGVGAVVVILVGIILWLAMSREKPVMVAAREGQSSTTTPPPEGKTETGEPAKPTEQPGSEKKTPEPSQPPVVAAPVQPPKEEPAPKPVVEPPKAPVPETKPAVAKPAAPTSPEQPATSPAAPATPQPPPKPETPPQAAPKQKLPVPNEAALEQARKAADALFNPEIEKTKTSSDKVALANRLLAQAIDQTGAADKYVLMVMAQNLAVAARDAVTAFQVIDQLAEAFEVDRSALKTEILTGWAKEARTPDTRKRVVEQMLAVGDEALDAGNLDVAKELGKLATSKSSGLRDKDIVQKLKAYRQRFTEAGKDIEELKEAQTTLAQDPKNAKANLVVGQYFCFTKGDWKKGLPLLAAGGDETLKGLANQELTLPPAQPDQQVVLADAWWEIASTRRHSQMNSIKIHAGLWYRQADAGLPLGLGKNKVEQRLAEVSKLRSQLPSPPLAIAPFDEKRAKQHQQRWAGYVGEPVETTNSIGMKFVLIPPGEFDMGSTPEEIAAEIERAKKNNESQGYCENVRTEGPSHRVKISKPFYLAMYQVMQGEYEKVMGTNPSAFTEKQADVSTFKPSLSEGEVKYRKMVAGKETSRHPVETVNWEEAMEFCRRLSAMPAERAARRVYRLPTEAEFEYACRAGTTTRWYCGDDEAGLADVAWFGKNASSMTHPVGEKRSNAWGLSDMHSNVWQWCSDWYSHYAQSPQIDPIGPPTGSLHVLRGGFWYYYPFSCRSALRYNRAPADRSHDYGFRVVAGR